VEQNVTCTVVRGRQVLEAHINDTLSLTEEPYRMAVLSRLTLGSTESTHHTHVRVIAVTIDLLSFSVYVNKLT